jgi:hypothetical protein
MEESVDRTFGPTVGKGILVAVAAGVAEGMEVLAVAVVGVCASTVPREIAMNATRAATVAIVLGISRTYAHFRFTTMQQSIDDRLAPTTIFPHDATIPP